MINPRYVRFAQALTLAVAPACSGASPEPSSKVEPPTAEAVPRATLSKSVVAPPVAPSVDPVDEPATEKSGSNPVPHDVLAVADASLDDEAPLGAPSDAAAPVYPHSSGPIAPSSLGLRVLARLVPEPGSTPLAKEYRSLVRALGKDESHGSFERAAYDPRSVREARVRWKRRMVDEYASTTVFSALVSDLVEANASLDASVVALRMAQDEFRHAEICGHVVTAMGGSSSAPRETTVRPLARHDGVSSEERALRNVLVTSISEMYSVAFFVASLETMTDPFLRAVTRDLLADEVLHGRFGFHYLEAWAEWLASRPEVRASIARYLRYVFAVCEKEFLPGHLPQAGDDDAALGLLTGDASRGVFEETMAKAVAPGLDRFELAASDAWRRRSLST